MPIFPNKYKPIKQEARSPRSAVKMLLLLWCYILILFLYFSEEIELFLIDSSVPFSEELTYIVHNINQNLPLSRTKTEINDTAQYLYQQEYRFGSRLSIPEPPDTEVLPIISTEKPSVNDVQKKKYAPQNILLVGASSMHSRMGAELVRSLKEELQHSHIQRHAKLGTGLSRPDVYNWPEITLELLKKHQSDLVIAQFIGNDCQSLINSDRSLAAKYGSMEWDEAYKERVRLYVKSIQAEGAQVVLVGMPIVRPKRFQKRIMAANQLVKDVADELEVPFISLWKISTTADGNFKESVRVNGRTLPFRHEDGIHLSTEGSKQVAQNITDQLKEMYHWDEKTLKPELE